MTAKSVARIKAELQEKGVRIPAALVGELETQYNAPSVRNGDLVLCLDSPRDDGELIPVYVVNGKRGLYSPLELIKNGDGQFELRRNGVRYARATVMPRPRFYGTHIRGKVPMHRVAAIIGPGHLRSMAEQRCVYQQNGQGCKFCTIDYWWNTTNLRICDQIAETIEAAVREGVVDHVSLTTPTLDKPDRGLANLVDVARLIRPWELPVMLEIEPLRDHTLLAALLVDARNAGVTSISVNVECFDERVRAAAMPAKGRIPLREYEDNWALCHHIFGENEALTVVIVGIGESDESILAGIELAAAHGIITYPVPLNPTAGSAYEDLPPPSADRMLRIYHEAINIFVKHGLDLFRCSAGHVRGGSFSAILEVARFGV